MKEAQIDFIIRRLKLNKKISRNECLQVFITRLASRIRDLKDLGWVFDAGRTESNDYVYLLKHKPKGF